jgi:hypothetical protein
LGDLFEGDEAGPASVVKAFETGGDEDAVFVNERDEVRNRSDGDEVEERAEVEFGCPGEAGVAAAFDEGVGEFEGETDGTKRERLGEGARGRRKTGRR